MQADRESQWTSNDSLNRWIEEIKALCKPERIHICDGTQEEYDALCNELVKKKTFVRLNPAKRPGSFWCRSTPDDVARVEESTFICSLSQEDAGPTNNWVDPAQMHATLNKLFDGCMRGRTMYVIPYCMGPLHSPLSRIGIEISDSAYVVCNLYIMTRIGKKVLDVLGNGPFIPCVHSLGVPLLEKEDEDVHWPCCSDKKYIVHFPEEKSIWSFGSGYGGNALLSKKGFALRIASVIAKEEGWLAEHMLIMGVTNPQGEKKYFAAAFPSACGKTNLAMLSSSLPGWKIETVGDDIAWMKIGPDGRLYAINPEYGFFGVAPGTSYQTNPNAMKTIEKNTLFTNTALTEDLDVWWEGMTPSPPQSLTSWLGMPWSPNGNEKAAHPNSRFTVPASQCPVIDPSWEDPKGVPISAIIFGGRRSATMPLVFESFNWQHGTFIGTSLSSETTAAAKGEVGRLRHDPFAMTPFCGYHMGDYFAHWLAMGKKSDKMPRIFYVNWFRKSKDSKFLWPGFGENVRVLQWIFERVSGKDYAVKSPIGYLPSENAIDTNGLSLSKEDLQELFSIHKKDWEQEVASLEEYYSIFGSKLPAAIGEELKALQQRL